MSGASAPSRTFASPRSVRLNRLIPTRSSGHDGDDFRHRVLLWAGQSGSASETHDLNPISDLENMGHIVTDQDDGKATIANRSDQIQHLTGLANAQSRRGFVHDH